MYNDAAQTISTTVQTTSTVAVTPLGGKRKKREAGAKLKHRKREPVRRMPYYAVSVCGGEAAYESARACMGVYSGTTSAATPTTTMVIASAWYSPTETETATSAESETVTSTETVTSASTATSTSVAIAHGPFHPYVDSQVGGPGYTVFSQYAEIGPGSYFPLYSSVRFDASDIPSASLF